jgi:DNA helicase-2/ATP-dependent DNA helicase PcrA
VYESGPDPTATTHGPHRFQVVDWKTGLAESADPLQLAIYRLAWAEVTHTPLDQVDAVFYLVRSDRLVRPESLASRDEIEALMSGGGADPGPGAGGRPRAL